MLGFLFSPFTHHHSTEYLRESLITSDITAYPFALHHRRSADVRIAWRRFLDSRRDALRSVIQSAGTSTQEGGDVVTAACYARPLTTPNQRAVVLRGDATTRHGSHPRRSCLVIPHDVIASNMAANDQGAACWK
jgi:hypothetical protein